MLKETVDGEFTTVADVANTVAFLAGFESQCADRPIDRGQPRLVHAVREPTMRRSNVNTLTSRSILTSAYDEIGLVLQGGGALGSYQAGVYEGLAEVGVEPTWISGISIGALNTAIIAGNAPEDRVEALRGFWETISQARGRASASSAPGCCAALGLQTSRADGRAGGRPRAL